MANTTVHFLAVNSITLEAGFHATAGSNFIAAIMPCTTPFTETPLVNARLGVDDSKDILTNLTFAPNPANYSTNIHFDLPESSPIHLAVFDSAGKLVKQIANNQYYEAGTHQKELAVHSMPKGLYYVRLATQEKVITKSLVVIN